MLYPLDLASGIWDKDNQDSEYIQIRKVYSTVLKAKPSNTAI
jgi:hypothetical protein